MSAVAIIIMACAFFMFVAPMASAEKSVDIPLGISFPRVHSTVTVFLDKLELSDFRMGNVYSSTPLDRVQWVRLWYHYENRGNQTQDGYLTVKLIDSNGNVWDEPDGSYTGEKVGPGSRSVEKFLEFPIPKDVTITQIKSIQGFNEDMYDVPAAPTATPTATPTAVPSAASSSAASATPGQGSGSCLPLLPFALLSMVGLAGIAAGKMQRKK